MTNTPDDEDRAELRAWARSVFDAAADAPPPDVVDRGAWRGLTADDLRRLNRTAGTWAQVTTPGEPVTDSDGNPSHVTAPTTNTVYRGGAVVTHAQLYKAGLTAADVPNLTVIDSPTRKD